MQSVWNGFNVGLAIVATAATFAVGCGGEDGEFDGAEVAEVAESGEAINRGQLLTSTSAPYSSVVRTSSSLGICSAVKISSRRYLTAAHCLLRANCTYLGEFNKIDVTNAADATGTGTSITLSAAYIHPSYFNNSDNCNGNPTSEHSYDIAIMETSTDATPTIPSANPAFWPNHVEVGTKFRQVGYGRDTFDASRYKKKQFADYASVSDPSVASYAHYIRTLAAQSGNEGDSGGPLLYEASSGTWRIAGITSAGNGGDGRAKGDTYFTRVANVGRWINSPHNGSTSNSGYGFFQSVTFRQCMRVTSSAAGTAAKLSQCEGYDPNLHGQLWEVVTSGAYQQIRTRKSGATRCLDVQANTNNVIVADCSSSQTQQWTIATHTPIPSLRIIKNRGRNLYLSDSTQGGLQVTPNSEAMWLYYR